MKRDDFYISVYEIVKEIPKGYVATYGQIAFLLGVPQSSRRVGQALSHTPEALKLPCHRVVNSQGRLAPGWKKQRGLLTSEGIAFKENGCVNLKNFIWRSI